MATKLNQIIQKPKCGQCGNAAPPNSLFIRFGNSFCNEACLNAYDEEVEQMKAEDLRAEADYELEGWEEDLLIQGDLS